MSGDFLLPLSPSESSTSPLALPSPPRANALASNSS
nr:hypothetical protein CoNPh38_CDS0172 [Staphylococcus phage S-CoN_Ph38]